VREPDGLAYSSRNRYLDADQRRQAPVLFQALEAVRHLVAAGQPDAAVLRKCLVENIATAPTARLDYAEIVDAEHLQPVERVAGSVLVAVAVYFGSTRLIDNLLLNVNA
jgi:pantoate--beta-alanine ligase